MSTYDFSTLNTTLPQNLIKEKITELTGGSVFVDLLFDVLPIVCGCSVLVFVRFALLFVHSSFANILTRKRELVALLLLSFGCLVTMFCGSSSRRRGLVCSV